MILNTGRGYTRVVTITDIARDKIQEALGQNAGKYLRLFIQGIGWGGPNVGMALDEPDDDETPVTVNGIGVLVSEPVQPYVKATIIDYIKEDYGEGFVLKGRKNNC